MATSILESLPTLPTITTDQANPETTRTTETATSETPAAVAPVTYNVNAPTDTVQGQMTSLLDQNSDYMKSAKTSALQGMNSKGLINSSMAIGASQKAAIDSAMPIATQDASTYASQGRANQDAQNRFKENEQAFGMNKAINEQNQRLALDRMDVEDFYKRSSMQLESTLKGYNDTLYTYLQAELAKVQADEKTSADMKVNYAGAVSSMTNNYISARQAIMTSDITAAAQTTALNNLEAQFMADSDYLKEMIFGANAWDW